MSILLLLCAVQFLDVVDGSITSTAFPAIQRTLRFSQQTTFRDGPDRHAAIGVWGANGGLAAAAGVFLGGLIRKPSAGAGCSS
jgi:hypothetical protein